MKNINKITMTGLLASLNIIGAFIASALKLPIYLDSIGTIMSSVLFGPLYAAGCGFISGLVSGAAFDPYSFYFIPVQIITGICSGWIYRKGLFDGFKAVFSAAAVSLPASLAASVIAAYVFGGITSSGSSYIVQIMSAMGVNRVLSVFITQILTDYMDKLISIVIVVKMASKLPYYLKGQKSC